MGLLPTHMLNNPQRMLSMIAQRQECLSDNIANMHTKGYRRKDVNFSQFLPTDISSRLEANMVEKYGPSPLMSATTGNGEQITTEEELAKMQENYLLYNVAVRHLSSTITEIKTALNVSANG